MQGTLIVRAYTSDALIPVPRAIVSVTTRNAQGETILLGLRQTDESGFTEPLVIQTPERSESLTSGNTQPYALVDITCNHPNYDEVIIHNAQVFPNIVSVQNIALLPLQLFPSSPEPEQIDIPPQNL